MPRWMRCRVDEVAVLVSAAEYAERIGEGKIVDFDRVLIPADEKADPPRAAFTLEDALSGHAAHFEPVVDADQRVATQQPSDRQEPAKRGEEQ